MTESCAVCDMTIHGSPYRRGDTTYHQSCRPDTLPRSILRDVLYSTTQQETNQ